MEQSTRSPWPGVVLIVLGVVFLIANFTDVHLQAIWPIFVLGPGIFFFIRFFQDRKEPGLLMPATILTVIGLLFFECELQGWDMMQHLWPLFMMAPGLGLGLMYYLGKGDKALLIPAGILTGLSLIFLMTFNDSGYLWPTVLILFGILILFAGRKDPSRPIRQDSPPAL